MDIDRLFKVPKLPVGGIKRKLPDNPTPELLKKLKVDGNGHSDSGSPTYMSTAETRPKKVTIEEIRDEDESFAPGGDADYFVEDDDEGRFYGGGLTSEQKEILNIFDRAEDDQFQDISITQVRKLLSAFDRAVKKNQDQRSKYPDDPSKFIDSEADLDGALKALLPLSQSPALAYTELIRSGALTQLIGLLTHENMDIVIDVVELIYELTDDDAEVDSDNDGHETSEEALKILVEGLVENQTLELLVDNLSRLNEKEDADRQGLFHILGILENVIAFNPALSPDLVSKTTVLRWLLDRIQWKTFDENRGYAAELISILLQDETENKLAFGENNGVEVVLKVISHYRRRDPSSAEESEFMENLFDSLCSALSENAIKQSFLEAEGPELMILMMKEKTQAKARSIKVLDYALSGVGGTSICETFVEALGLKTLFMALMGKTSKRQKSAIDELAKEDTAHILGIISSLLTNLPSESSGRLRVMAKFVEGDYEKVEKLLELREVARKRLVTTDTEVDEDRKVVLDEEGEEAVTSDVEDSFYNRRLDGGLFTLQTVDYILAWLMMEDDGIRSHALRMLSRSNQSLNDILQTLQTYRNHIADTEDGMAPLADSPISQKDILQALMTALDDKQ